MAHEISIVEGRPEFFYYGEKPWHGLGTQVDHILTAREALQSARLDWTVKKKEVFFRDEKNYYASAGAYATVRTDIDYPLGIVSEKYIPIQNTEAFDFIDTLVASKEAKYITAGALFKGKKVFLLCQLPGQIVLNNKDNINKYLLLVNSHDGSSTMRVYFTAIRVVCNNTLNIALSASNETETVRIHHKGDMQDKIKQAREILGISAAYFKEMEETYAKFANYIISMKEATEYFKTVVNNDTPQASRVRSQIEKLYYEGAGAELAVNTLWGAYNAVVEYVDHYKVDYNAKPDQYLNSILFGSGKKLKDIAYNQALKMAV